MAAHVIRDEQQRTKSDIRLLKTDIVTMIMKAFLKSFEHVGNNKKAIAKRGWSPLNRSCLHNKIMEKKGNHTYASEDELDTEFIRHNDLNRRHKFSKSEWLRIIERSSVDKISVSGASTVTYVVEVLRGSKQRVTAQEKEHLLNRKKKVKACANVDYEMDAQQRG